MSTTSTKKELLAVSFIDPLTTNPNNPRNPSCRQLKQNSSLYFFTHCFLGALGFPPFAYSSNFNYKHNTRELKSHNSTPWQPFRCSSSCLLSLKFNHRATLFRHQHTSPPLLTDNYGHFQTCDEKKNYKQKSIQRHKSPFSSKLFSFLRLCTV